MPAYYNELDPFAAQWLRNLIAAGHIAPGEVDERSIVDVRAADLRGFDQCHFFAGIGVWSHALRGAGWADDRPVWTGSCPCQPFSAAGAGKEFADERHLWPAWFELIRICRPVAVFGEQVASRDALAWLDHVCADLEAEGYAVGAVDTCAAGYGAPHIRQRLYWVADAAGVRFDGLPEWKPGTENDTRGMREPAGESAVSVLADADIERRQQDARSAFGDETEDGRARWHEQQPDGDNVAAGDGADARALADDDSRGRQILGASRLHADGQPGDDVARRSAHGMADSAGEQRGARRIASARDEPGTEPGLARPCTANGHGPSATNGFWSDAEWLACPDGKARPTEPGTFPLVAGASQRVGRLRAYGNSIVGPQAQAFVEAFMLKPCASR